jgi:hypothetical protein
MTMAQLRDPAFRQAIRTVVDALDGRCALAGTVGVQLHLALAVGADKPGPPARRVEVVPFGDQRPPERAGGFPVVVVESLGFAASVEAATSVVRVDGEAFPVASPEHVLAMILGAPDLGPDGRWAGFILMRTCPGMDLEEVRGFLKRCDSVERQSLLAELAYLAA